MFSRPERPHHRLFSEWRVAAGPIWLRDGLRQRRCQRGLRALRYLWPRPASQTKFRPRVRLTQILHHLRSTRGIRTILRVSHVHSIFWKVNQNSELQAYGSQFQCIAQYLLFYNESVP